jgi:hypothetical protein
MISATIIITGHTIPHTGSTNVTTVPTILIPATITPNNPVPLLLTGLTIMPNKAIMYPYPPNKAMMHPYLQGYFTYNMLPPRDNAFTIVNHPITMHKSAGNTVTQSIITPKPKPTNNIRPLKHLQQVSLNLGSPKHIQY